MTETMPGTMSVTIPDAMPAPGPGSRERAA